MGFDNWKKTTDKFLNHSESVSHKNSEILYLDRVQQEKNNSSITNFTLESHNQELKINTVISWVISLAKQGVVFRGNDKKLSLNRGNFIELLKFERDN